MLDLDYEVRMNARRSKPHYEGVISIPTSLQVRRFASNVAGKLDRLGIDHPHYWYVQIINPALRNQLVGILYSAKAFEAEHNAHVETLLHTIHCEIRPASLGLAIVNLDFLDDVISDLREAKRTKGGPSGPRNT
jgi:hypothetical protein